MSTMNMDTSLSANKWPMNLLFALSQATGTEGEWTSFYLIGDVFDSLPPCRFEMICQTANALHQNAVEN